MNQDKEAWVRLPAGCPSQHKKPSGWLTLGQLHTSQGRATTILSNACQAGFSLSCPPESKLQRTKKQAVDGQHVRDSSSE